MGATNGFVAVAADSVSSAKASANGSKCCKGTAFKRSSEAQP